MLLAFEVYFPTIVRRQIPSSVGAVIRGAAENAAAALVKALVSCCQTTVGHLVPGTRWEVLKVSEDGSPVDPQWIRGGSTADPLWRPVETSWCQNQPGLQQWIILVNQNYIDYSGD